MPRKSAEDVLHGVLKKAERLSYIKESKAPVGAEFEYRAPTKIMAGKVCADCHRPIAYCSGMRCRECFRVNVLDKYVQRMRERQIKLRIINPAPTDD